MSDAQEQPSELVSQFKQLTDNLQAAARAAWASPERKQLQADLTDGLETMRESLNAWAHDFSASEAGQQIKSDLSDLNRRVQSGELEQKARTELVGLLSRLNSELESAVQRLSEQDDEATAEDDRG